MRLGLGLKFVLLVIGILSVTLAAATYRLIGEQQRTLERGLFEKGQAVGSFAALIAPQPILALDFVALDDIVREIRSKPDVIMAVILDPKGRPMTSQGNAPEGEAAAADAAIRMTFPVVHDDTDLGTLVILLDRSRLETELADLVRRQVAAYGLIFVFLSLCIVVVFRHSVLRPVRSLIDGVNRMADNDFATPVVVSGRDELGRLGLAFNAMMADIRDSHKQLDIQSRALERSPAAVVITDADGVIQYVNPKFVAVTGYSAEEAIGQRPSILKSGETSAEEYRDLWATIRGGRVWRGEFHNKKRNGELFWESASISPVMADDGTITHFVAVKEDITEAKAERAKLDRTLDEYARSNAELQRFAYVASHDLQEPLRSVRVFGQLLAREAGEALGPKQREYLDFMTNGAARMSNLVHDLMAYSTVTSRSEEFRAVDINTIAETAKVNLASVVEETGAVIRWEGLPTVRGDEMQLVQLFQNLFSNAIKFRRPDVPPEIVVEATRNEGRWVFDVSDNGIGILPEYREQIFVIFKRLHTSDRYPGTGVGLAICKRIVERHGGEIDVVERDGPGTTFRFTLPAAD